MRQVNRRISFPKIVMMTAQEGVRAPKIRNLAVVVATLVLQGNLVQKMRM
ncbi:hypothetical protein PC116_g25995 [Phytophthora cactorum]|nr:hypothetical protein PC116_g25995 [Phytophthora cactorum]